MLAYHGKYFLALAYFNMCQAQFDEASKKGKGMGIAMTQGVVCLESFEAARPFVNQLGGPYKTNFDKKIAECGVLCKKAEDENKKIYYESAMARADLPKADPQNFANLSSVADEINKTPELDAKLRHLVPPAVRAMQEELKNVLQGLVQAEFSKISTYDEQMNGFLKQFGLPNALHSLTANQDVPDAIWTKIEEF